MLKRRKLLITLSGFTLAFLSRISPAIASSWELLGERTVRLVTDRDIVPVSLNKQYTRLKLKVKNTGIEMIGMRITFLNGRTYEPPLRQFIAKGSESRVIDLPGRDRVIRSITLLYKARPGSTERALVQIYGKTA